MYARSVLGVAWRAPCSHVCRSGVLVGPSFPRSLLTCGTRAGALSLRVPAGDTAVQRWAGIPHSNMRFSPRFLGSQRCARRRACPSAQDPRLVLLQGLLGGVPPTCFQNLPLPPLGAARSPSSCLSQELLTEHGAGLLRSRGVLGPHMGAALQRGSPPAPQPSWDFSHFFLMVP